MRVLNGIAILLKCVGVEGLRRRGGMMKGGREEEGKGVRQEGWEE